MPTYTVTVFEQRSVECLYTIEARDPEHALRLAAEGNTIDEEEVKDHGVGNREVIDAPKLLSEDPPSEDLDDDDSDLDWDDDLEIVEGSDLDEDDEDDPWDE